MQGRGRSYSLLDQVLMRVDYCHQVLSRKPSRPYPVLTHAEPRLTAAQQRLSGKLMRVNHSGEVAAQALYLAQGIVAKDIVLREHMGQMAAEEKDHLYWCRWRLEELRTRPSALNPLWFGGSVMIGLVAGAIGDGWNLGFLQETEYQVTEHLRSHLSRLPQADHRSRLLVREMAEDEAHHARVATQRGARVLPQTVCRGMRCVAGLMTRTSYHL